MLEGFLTFILITVVGFWILGIVGRFLLKRWVAKKQREFQQQYGGDGTSFSGKTFYGNFNFGGRKNQPQNQSERKEGEVFIKDAQTSHESHINKQVGEYVDFEDVE